MLRLALLSALLLPAAYAQPVAVEPAFPALPLFQIPVGLETAPGETRLFVVDKVGVLLSFENDPAVSRVDTLIDLRDVVSSNAPSWEEGLLGLAFHPRYQANGHFFVHYTTFPAAEGEGHRTIIARFTVPDPAAGAPRADRESEVVLFDIEQPFQWHNGGQLAFHPNAEEANLYFSFGDGGSAGDPLDHGQNRATLFGSILRVNVDDPGQGRNYGIPPDNPFAGNAEGWREEIWAYGLRNPWRFSIDRGTGDLWVGDVGQNQWEEVSVVREAGANLGWDAFEGMHCFEGPCDLEGVTFPAWEYSHADGRCSVTGGYVYRGTALPELDGRYVYGDFCTGQVWALEPDASENTELFDADFLLSSFGVDAEGELYAIGWDTRRIYRFARGVVAAEPSAPAGRVALRPAFPNPFASSSTLRFEQAEPGPVRLAVYDVLGREVAVLFDGPAPAGEHPVRFDAAGLAPGVYVVRMTAGGQAAAQALTLVR